MEIFASHTSDELIPKYIRNSYNSIAKKSITPTKNWTENLNRNFSKDIQMANSYIKRCTMSLIIGRIQMKTTMRYYLIPIRRDIIKNKRKPVLIKMWRKGNQCALLVGM